MTAVHRAAVVKRGVHVSHQGTVKLTHCTQITQRKQHMIKQFIRYTSPKMTRNYLTMSLVVYIVYSSFRSLDRVDYFKSRTMSSSKKL